jgi:hypothetical protein
MFRVVVHQPDAVEEETIAVSVEALLLFAVGYLFPARSRVISQSPGPMIKDCGNFAYVATMVLAVPATILAVQFWRTHSALAYGEASDIPFSYQAILYSHLFFGFMYLGSADPDSEGWKRILTAITLVTLPRLIISLHWGRFFLAQAIVPALLIAFARGWIRLSVKRVLQLALIALAILFVPSLTRGDSVFGQGDIIKWFAAGSSLQLYQDNTDLNLNGRCPPLLVSLSAKTIPYSFLGVCVLEVGSEKNMPATIDRILTVNAPANRIAIVGGTGSNYLLDLYLFGGSLAVFLGSGLFGFSCQRFVAWIGKPSLFSGIWAEALTRALMAPRGGLGYVFERIPSLIFATLFVIFAVWVGRLFKRELCAISRVDAVSV